MPPIDRKGELDSEIRRSRRNWLEMPAIGMESEFNVWLDEVEINPEPYWKHPGAFIDRPLLKREKSSLQLPTGGAVYFDRGVIEVVTPVIELAPSATARMVRNLWEQIGFVREQLTKWGEQNGHTVRLKAYSTHYNVSYEIPKSRQHARRNVKALALLLAYLLPVPVMITGANRRSTGVGVRPRGNRIEITVDFTPDPGLMIATAALVVGIVREVMSWPSYDLSLLESLPLPVIAGVIPGKHTTRKGWLTKDFHYPQSPYTSDIDAPIWTTQFGEKKSLRQIAKEVAFYFRLSIRKYSDPFSLRLLFAILEGRAPSLLDLDERPKAYEDVGNLCRWGEVIEELREFGSHERRTEPAIEQYVIERHHAREQHESNEPQPIALKAAKPRIDDLRPRPLQTRAAITTYYIERRRPVSLLNGNGGDRRRGRDRRRNHYAIPFPDRRLTRSAYEQVFLKLVSGGHLRLGDEVYTPVGMKGWYHAIFRRDSDGAEKLLTIDQLLRKMNDWI
ncbi:MAG: hypothetical protein DMF56_03750 [Acidobacteria bacterium]|nr:MAG: hypothetical protein DMF56_03750 [Acidobacteriota bacterium]